MTLRTLLLYLIGDRQAILTLASDRRALWVGLLFVLSAGFAREYDVRSLVHEPYFLLLPLGVSLVASLILFCALFRPVIPSEGHTPSVPSFWFAYERFLTLFWMTAPLAWLYAIPYEQFLSPQNATIANLLTLGLVAAWRVALTVRVVSVLMGYSGRAAFFNVLGCITVVSLVAGCLVAVPLICTMSGLHQKEGEGIVVSVGWYVVWAAVGFLPICALGLILTHSERGPWQGPLAPSEPRTFPSRGVWCLAISSVAIWGLILPFTQPSLILKTEVDNDLKGGRIAEGLALMSAHQPGDFPQDWDPHWDPPPFTHVYGAPPHILDVMEVMIEHPPAAWVRDYYLAKCRVYLRRQSWGPSEFAAPRKMANLFLHLPEGPSLAAEYPEAVESALQSSDLSRDDRDGLVSLLEQSGKSAPKQQAH
jgi:hypothetical protein